MSLRDGRALRLGKWRDVALVASREVMLCGERSSCLDELRVRIEEGHALAGCNEIN